jgi:LmbE family N-acetylglucosaminyl deacetylase
VRSSLNTKMPTSTSTTLASVPALPAGRQAHMVVISPHLDDASLSTGATISHRVHTAGVVLVLTVFSGDPVVEGPTSERGNTTASSGATAQRRQEDLRACSLVGATPAWLPFADKRDAVRDPDEVWVTIAGLLDAATTILVPGFPLSNADHSWVIIQVLSRTARRRGVGPYVEQPHAAWLQLSRRGRSPARPTGVPVPIIARHVPGGAVIAWRPDRTCCRCSARKFRALGAYRSQLAVLHRWPRVRIAAYEALARGETIGWL